MSIPRKIALKLLTLTILTTVLFSPILYFNVIIDPFGIFKGESKGLGTEPNKRFLKVKYIIENPQTYDTYIFGSSRVGNINISSEPTVKGYNMSYSLGLPKEHLEDLMIFKENKVTIKTIIISLDDISYLSSPEINSTNPLRYSYLTYKKNPLMFYLNYALMPPNIPQIKQALSPQSATSVDQEIEKDIDKHIKSNKFLVPSIPNPIIYRVDKTIEDIRQIHDFCLKNNIKLIIFVNPLHVVTYKNLNADMYCDFIQKLAGITPYYNFSGLNSITTNNYYYYETSHYRPLVGDKILSSILGGGQDFGTYITNDNINDYIKKVHNELGK